MQASEDPKQVRGLGKGSMWTLVRAVSEVASAQFSYPTLFTNGIRDRAAGLHYI